MKIIYSISHGFHSSSYVEWPEGNFADTQGAALLMGPADQRGTLDRKADVADPADLRWIMCRDVTNNMLIWGVSRKF